MFSGLVRSTWCRYAPAFSSSRIASSLRAPAWTWYPALIRLKTVSRPMPDDAPVTTATFLSNVFISMSPWTLRLQIDIYSRRPTRLVMRGIVHASLLYGSPMSGRRALPCPEGAVEGIGIFVAEQVGDFVGVN